MTGQTDIFAEMNSGTPLAARFAAYHAANPHVYDEIVMLARRAKRSGAQRIGMKQLWEVMRWRHMLSTRDPEGWKLNNDYTSCYARLVMLREGDLAGMFELRRSSVDSAS